MAYVLEFEDPNALDATVVGGKGANLARLTQAGLAVPAGVIVTADAYRAFVDADASWYEAISRLESERPEVLREQCSALRDRLRSLPLPAAVESRLRQRLPAQLAGAPVSVRSSATLEDLAGAAFAGQHDTYLNVASLDEVLDAVRRCFASLWEDRAVCYRHERGFGQDAVTMAVVIQSMVTSEVAGVAFCMNPISGNLGEVVVNSAYGLGEIVVSGEGDVDQYVMNKRTGEVVARHIGEKTHSIVSAANGTARVEVSAERRGASSLADPQLAEVLRLSLDVERLYGFPQDIEWAIAGGRLWLLQSRPVTHFPERWTRDESAERFPNVVTPLTWDFTREGFHESLAHSLRLMGLPAYEGRWFERFDGYVYGNQTAVQLFASGQQVAFESLDELREKIPLFRERYRWVQELPVLWARDLDHYLFSLGVLSAAKLEALSAPALWEHVHALDRLGRDYFRPNIAISITQAVLHRTLFRILNLLVGPDRAPALYDQLTCFCDTKTNVVNRDLYELYQIARRDPSLQDLLLNVDRRTLWEERRFEAHPAFASAFAAFLRDHGHREVDFDAYHPTWIGQPWVVLENLRLMLMREGVQAPVARERELRVRQQAAEYRLISIVPEDLPYFTAEILRLARAYTALDDLEHYQTTRLALPFRAALVELGRRLRERGVLDEPEDIFFLRKSTLESLMAGDLSEAEGAAEARRNKTEYAIQRGQTPPHVWGAEAARPAEGGLRGLPGSPGVAEGAVCRVYTVEDFPRFLPGSVLVARTTNPAWTPLFYSACAVITESGGPLSHGAVTAREVGLPAVMAVRGALDVLTDGERVQVNGTAGTVTRLG